MTNFQGQHRHWHILHLDQQLQNLSLKKKVKSQSLEEDERVS
jgi:hypothetical protein